MDILPQIGRVDWIGLRPGRREPMSIVDRVSADPASGLLGDRYSGRTGTRHATLIQAEHLPAIASYLGQAVVPPELLRRNILVSGINLLALKGKDIHIGDVALEMTGSCQPCSRMEDLLGPGGYNAVRGHGGVTARILTAGEIAIGDPVSLSGTNRISAG